MKRGLGFSFMVPKRGVGRVWRQFNAHLDNNFLLRGVGKRNLPHETHEMGLPRWEWQVPRKEGFGLPMLLKNGVGRVDIGWFRKDQNEP